MDIPVDLPQNVMPLSKLLKELKEAKSHEQAVSILKARDHQIVRGLFKLAIDVRIKFALPEGQPPYERNDMVTDDMKRIYSELGNIAQFVQGAGQFVNSLERERDFISLLERLSATEAALVCEMKDKIWAEKYNLDAYSIAEAWGPFIMFPESFQEVRKPSEADLKKTTAAAKKSPAKRKPAAKKIVE